MWIAPQFGQYHSSLAEVLTRWIYADALGNPKFHDQPDKWPMAGVLSWRDVTLNFTGIPVGGGVASTANTPLNMGGGRNTIVFQRTATVVPTTPPADPNVVVLPNQLPAYVTLRQTQQTGLDEVEVGPITNLFGFGSSPHIFPVPETWLGNVVRNFTVVNNTGVIVNVALTWRIAYLFTGR